jgi:hypothetical protein
MDRPVALIGVFFNIIGSGLMLIFIASIFAHETTSIYLLLSLGAFFIGFLFRRQTGKIESQRFSTLRRFHGHNRQREQEHKKNQENN